MLAETVYKFKVFFFLKIRFVFIIILSCETFMPSVVEYIEFYEFFFFLIILCIVYGVKKYSAVTCRVSVLDVKKKQGDNRKPMHFRNEVIGFREFTEWRRLLPSIR